jgi:hypothetical protein
LTARRNLDVAGKKAPREEEKYCCCGVHDESLPEEEDYILWCSQHDWSLEGPSTDKTAKKEDWLR